MWLGGYRHIQGDQVPLAHIQLVYQRREPLFDLSLEPAALSLGMVFLTAGGKCYFIFKLDSFRSHPWVRAANCSVRVPLEVVFQLLAPVRLLPC